MTFRNPDMTFRYMEHAQESYFVEDATRLAASLASGREAEAGASVLAASGRRQSITHVGVVAERFKAAVLKTAKGESPS
jgi:hypothetical protein